MGCEHVIYEAEDAGPAGPCMFCLEEENKKLKAATSDTQVVTATKPDNCPLRLRIEGEMKSWCRVDCFNSNGNMLEGLCLDDGAFPDYCPLKTGHITIRAK